MRQVFIGRNPKLTDDMAFERKLYVIRKRAENAIRYSGKVNGGEFFYISSLSYKTIVYKGMLMTEQVGQYYPRPGASRRWRPRWRWSIRASAPTRSRAGTARIRIATSRTTAKSTRCAATSTGCTRARRMFESELFGDDIKKILPIINTDGSDSAMFDNCLELLVLAGRSLPHAMMMMIPEPWTNHETHERREEGVLRISLAA